jgi:hypothetical protein
LENIKMDIEKAEWEAADWIDLTRDGESDSLL